MKVLSRGTPKKEGVECWDGEQAREAISGKPEIPPRFQKVKKSSQDQPFILALCDLFFAFRQREKTQRTALSLTGGKKGRIKTPPSDLEYSPGAQPLGVGISHSPFFHGLSLLL